MVTQKGKNRNFVADGVVFAEPNEVWIRELAEDDVWVYIYSKGLLWPLRFIMEGGAKECKVEGTIC